MQQANSPFKKVAAMSKTLFVGNLPYTMTEDSLKELFQAAGTVASVRIVLDRQTQQPKGFGFVEFEASDAADTAIAELAGHRVGVRELVVNEARPRESSRGARY
jgi:RNA recognition motif-containing protein